MIQSDDNLIKISQATNLSSAELVPAAWSIINMPADPEEASALFKKIYNTPTQRHVSLVLFRQRRKDKLCAISNVRCLQDTGWKCLDTVSIAYEKPSTCSNNGFLPVAETGLLVFKGAPPDTKNTSWFNSDLSNSSNLWDLSTQTNEGDYTYYQKFSWELNMLMLSLTTPMESAYFIYGCDLSDDDLPLIFGFCNRFKISVLLHTKTHQESLKIINKYNEFKRGLHEKS